MSEFEELLLRQNQIIHSIQRALVNYEGLGRENMTAATTRNRINLLREQFAECQDFDVKLQRCVDPKEKPKIPYFAEEQFHNVESIYQRTMDFMAKSLEELSTGVNVMSGAKLLPFFNRLRKGGDEWQVYRGNCMGYSTKGSVVYAGLDMTTGELCAITEWIFKIRTTKDKSNIQHITKQIGYIHKLQHPNLVRYLDMKYLEDGDAALIYVLQEFVIGTSCSFFLAENIPVDIDLLRYLATGILLALKFLHENNVVHKDLRDTSIYIDRTGTVKVSDYSLNKRLSDIYQTYTLVKPEQEFPSIQERDGKKADIYRFGALMFSLLNGVIASGDKIDPTVITQPDLQDFLLKCLTNDKRKRWSAEQLLQHTFIKAPLVRALSPPKVPRRDEQKNHEPEETDTDIRQYLPPLGGHSRITNEFEVLEWLGKGASGDVLKVKNKLDGRIYAIKRIELNPKNEQQDWKIIREVKSLSCMTHKNVVRYYNSWIENATDDMENLPDSGEDNSDVSMVTDNVKDIACGTVASNSIEFVKDSKCQETVSSVKEDETGDTYSSKATVREIQFMYIQMEFCEKSTLRTAIDAGLYKNQKRVWRLFEEIVEGLAHIHRRGIIHRDLKPVNIFLDSNDHVKIGDFGLARNILSSFVPTMATDKEPQVSKKGISFSTEDIGSLTEQVGTALYVAPELMTKAPYDQKVDIYSLGIILFEMCYKPPATGMERIKVLHNLRLKEIIIPTEMLQADMPLQIHILRRLLNHDPNQRPKAQEIRSLRAKALSFGQMVGKNYFKKTKGK